MDAVGTALHPLPVPPLATRIAAAFFALTWLLFPGFGLADLSVSWDPDWSVVLEASWGVFMTVLIAGSFLAVAVRPTRAAPAMATLGIAVTALLLSAAAGLEWQVIGYAVLLTVQTAVLLLGSGREPLRPVSRRSSLPLLGLAAAGVVPWLVHAERMFRANRRGAGEALGELTLGVDHHAVQGALALAVVALTLLAAVWPRGRRQLGCTAGVAAGYVGLVSFAFPATWAGLSPLWSVLCMAWGLAIAVLSAAVPRLQATELRSQVVEAERAL